MGKTAVIIGNGEFPKKEYPRYVISSADYIVCCDGALAKYLRNSEKIFGCLREPDAVIGDMDSLSAGLRLKYGHLIVHESEQETNDQTKAFRHIIGNVPDVSDIYITGATGLREDHTIGNISLLMEYAREYDLSRINLTMVSDHSVIIPVTDSIELDCGIGRRISILTPDNSLRIKSKGLEWKTDDVVFDNWWKATLNRASEDTVKLEFNHKSLAIIIMN
ncbi:MAG: thiamine diphosphokinase [Candidatus Cryptobacteroides sp.]